MRVIYNADYHSPHTLPNGHHSTSLCFWDLKGGATRPLSVCLSARPLSCACVNLVLLIYLACLSMLCLSDGKLCETLFRLTCSSFGWEFSRTSLSCFKLYGYWWNWFFPRCSSDARITLGSLSRKKDLGGVFGGYTTRVKCRKRLAAGSYTLRLTQVRGGAGSLLLCSTTAHLLQLALNLRLTPALSSTTKSNKKENARGNLALTSMHESL